jgi:hypothetical protein
MKAALIRAYGQPAFANEQRHLWKWKWPRSLVVVHLYQHNTGGTTVTFLNDGI